MATTTSDPLDQMCAFIKNLSYVDQLMFWRKFRTVHRARIASTEAELCPVLLGAVSTQIRELEAHLANGR